MNQTTSSIVYSMNRSNQQDVYNYTIIESVLPPHSNIPDLEDFMEVYVAPFVVVFGIFGNVLSLICLRRPPLNNFSPSVYMSAYALTSILFLIIIVALDSCLHMLDIVHFKHHLDSVCRIWEFLTRLIIFPGVWFVTGGSIDRCVALWWPSKAQAMCTVFMAKVAVVFIFIGMIFVSVHSMWTFQRHELEGCTVDFDQLGNTAWLWISSMLYTLIPQLLIFLFANLIVIRLCLKHRGRQIPESVSNEMDQTYAILTLASVVFIFSMPATSIHLLGQFHDGSEQLNTAWVVLNYMMWVCHICLVIILMICSAAFRESVKSLTLGCLRFIRTGSSVLEMRITKDEYQQVPSVSTNL